MRLCCAICIDILNNLEDANSQHQRNMHGHLATDETGGWGIQGRIVYFFFILGHTVMLLERKITEKNIILLKKKMYCLVAGLPS